MLARSQVKPALPPSFGALRLLDRLPAAAGSREQPSRQQGFAGLAAGQSVCPLTQRMTTIGRGLQNTVVLLDPAVSREHASLLLTDDGWRLENLSSHNPLWVDGHEVAPGVCVEIVPGSTLHLGRTALQLVAPSATVTLASEATRRLVTSDPDGEDPAATGLVNSLEMSSTRIFSPGVTLQFALRGEFSAGVRWLLAVAALAVFLVSAIATLGTASLVGHDALAAGGAGRVLAALTIPLVPVVGVAIVVFTLDSYEREPLVTLLGAFVWGAVIAIPPALFLEGHLSALVLGQLPVGGVTGGLTHALGQALVAGGTEELIKGLGLLLLLLALRDEFDNVTDGIIYGAVIGAGFAMVENFVYFALTPRADLGFVVVGRVVLGWLSHSTFTALFGAGLGYARETQNRRRQWLAPLAGLAAAIVLHTYFDVIVFGADALASLGVVGRADTLLAFGTLVADYVPLFAAQALLLRIALAALRREAATVREYLMPEVLSGVVTPDEYVLLQNASLRAAAEHRYALAYGLRAYLTARALYQTATGLAFRSWHVAMGDPPKRTATQPEDAYRARIQRLRRSLLRQIAASSAPPGDPGRSAAPTRPLVR